MQELTEKLSVLTADKAKMMEKQQSLQDSLQESQAMQALYQQ